MSEQMFGAIVAGLFIALILAAILLPRLDREHPSQSNDD